VCAELVGQGERFERVTGGVFVESLRSPLRNGDVPALAEQRIEVLRLQTIEPHQRGQFVLAQPQQRGEGRNLRALGDHHQQALFSEAA